MLSALRNSNLEAITARLQKLSLDDSALDPCEVEQSQWDLKHLHQLFLKKTKKDSVFVENGIGSIVKGSAVVLRSIKSQAGEDQLQLTKVLLSRIDNRNQNKRDLASRAIVKIFPFLTKEIQSNLQDRLID